MTPEIERLAIRASNHLNQLRDLCHSRSRNAGWHDVQREDGTLLALIHSEVSEALEGLRKDAQDDHLPHRKMAEVELADALIRILDFAGLKGYDIAGAFEEKLEYNLRRADHRREVRASEGGVLKRITENWRKHITANNPRTLGPIKVTLKDGTRWKLGLSGWWCVRGPV